MCCQQLWQLQNELARIGIGEVNLQINVGVLIRCVILQTAVQMTVCHARKLPQDFHQLICLDSRIHFSSLRLL